MRREKEEEEGGQKLLVFWGGTLVLLGVIKALFGVLRRRTAEEGRCERDFDAWKPRPGDDDDFDEDKEDGLFFFGERRQRIRHRPESKRRRECRNGCSAEKSRRDEMDEDARRSDGETIRRG